MADKKVASKEAAVKIVAHLHIFAEKVAEVVADHNEFKGENIDEQSKTVFAAACMNDVAILSDHLIRVLMEVTGTQPSASTTDDIMEQLAPEAAVIDLNEYKARGGLLN
jgi:hypothetical protein